MSALPNDGGPAFPRTVFLQSTGEAWSTTKMMLPQSGMTLRDWFAGMALSTSAIFIGEREATPAEAAVELAYFAHLIADAMLAEREKHADQ